MSSHRPWTSLAAAAALLLGSSCGSDESPLPPLIARDLGPEVVAPPPPPPDAGTDATAPPDAGPDPGDAAIPMDAATDGGSTDTGPADLGRPDAGPTDLDGDGIDDALEMRAAAEYLPFLSLDTSESCPLSVAIFRLGPHPDDAALWLIRYVALFQHDCGAGGHVGDNEGFSVTVDPSVPGAEGIVSLRAVSHRDTLCEAVTTCGRGCGSDVEACAFGPRRGVRYPVVFFSGNKHGAYTSESRCDLACVATNFCSLAAGSYEPTLLNVGEPGAPLASDLSAAGLITSGGGWTETSLFGYDPWGGGDFGGAGNVADQLMDPSLVSPTCR